MSATFDLRSVLTKHSDPLTLAVWRAQDGHRDLTESCANPDFNQREMEALLVIVAAVLRLEACEGYEAAEGMLTSLRHFLRYRDGERGIAA